MSATAVKSGSMIRVAVPVDLNDNRPIGQKQVRVSTVVKVGDDGRIHENEGWVQSARMGIDWEPIPVDDASQADPGNGPGVGEEIPKERKKPGRKPGHKKLVTAEGPVGEAVADPRQRPLPLDDGAFPFELWDLLAALGVDLHEAARTTDHQGVLTAIRTIRLLSIGARLEKKLMEDCPDAHP